MTIWCVLTSDTAPGTAAINAKAADAKSCSFMIVMYVLILQVLVICEHKIMFNYEVKYKVEFASKLLLLFDTKDILSWI